MQTQHTKHQRRRNSTLSTSAGIGLISEAVGVGKIYAFKSKRTSLSQEEVDLIWHTTDIAMVADAQGPPVGHPLRPPRTSHPLLQKAYRLFWAGALLGDQTLTKLCLVTICLGRSRNAACCPHGMSVMVATIPVASLCTTTHITALLEASDKVTGQSIDDTHRTVRRNGPQIVGRH